MVTLILSVLMTLALSFDAVAQPCELDHQEMHMSHADMSAEMPCHDMHMDMDTTPSPEAPTTQHDACCCAALLANITRFDAADLKHPFPGVLAWATPLPDTAMSIAFEYEPPPPRA